MEKVNFQKGILALSQAFPTIRAEFDKLSEPEQKVYLATKFSLLGDLSDEDFSRGLHLMLTTIEKLYPGDNWVAILMNLIKPKVSVLWTDVTEALLKYSGDLNFRYDPEGCRRKLDKLKSECPLAYVVGKKLGFEYIANNDNPSLLRSQIKAACEAEVERANIAGGVVETYSHIDSDNRIRKVIPLNKSVSNLLEVFKNADKAA